MGDRSCGRLRCGHFRRMKRRKKRAAVPLPLMMAETALSSWETIGHRTWMMAQGRCSPAEYQRMVVEKAQAAQAAE